MISFCSSCSPFSLSFQTKSFIVHCCHFDSSFPNFISTKHMKPRIKFKKCKKKMVFESNRNKYSKKYWTNVIDRNLRLETYFHARLVYLKQLQSCQHYGVLIANVIRYTVQVTLMFAELSWIQLKAKQQEKKCNKTVLLVSTVEQAFLKITMILL